MAGAVTHSEQIEHHGIPGLGAVPGFNQVMTSNSKEVDEDELLIGVHTSKSSATSNGKTRKSGCKVTDVRVMQVFPPQSTPARSVDLKAFSWEKGHIMASPAVDTLVAISSASSMN